MAYPAIAAPRGPVRSGGFSRTILAGCALASLIAGAGYAVLARLEPRETSAPGLARAAPPPSALLDPWPAAGARALDPFDSVAPQGRFVSPEAAAAAAARAVAESAAARREALAAAPPLAAPPAKTVAAATPVAPPATPVAASAAPVAEATAPEAPAPAALAPAAPGFAAPEPPRRPSDLAALAPPRPVREAARVEAARPSPAAPGSERLQAVAPRPERTDHLERLLPAEAGAASAAAPAAPAGRPAWRRARNGVARAPAPEESVVPRMFGGARETTGSLAYAPGPRLADDAMRPAQAPAPRLRVAALGPDPGPARAAPDAVAPRPRGGRAIYDIAGQVVILPDGTRLEAHSGLGPHRDDVRFKHLRMRGVTPPHVYNLTEREALFHGVRAIRLNPVGGSGAIFGRAGLLAHTYLLGPNGDSNGCVSIRNYQAFLDAFLKGEISQLVVVESLNGSSLMAQR